MMQRASDTAIVIVCILFWSLLSFIAYLHAGRLASLWFIAGLAVGTLMMYAVEERT